MTSIPYRPEIDGLRAIAVILVLLSHLGISGFQGGYIGVDMFFVISGYVITSLLRHAIEDGHFSFWVFVKHRAFRLIPALIPVIIFCIALTWLIFTPADLKAFSTSILGVVSFASNFVFWHGAGYFDAPSMVKPLLHTWSLAVEWQFYLIFPLLLSYVLRTHPRSLLSVLLVLALLSFIACIVQTDMNPSSAFYLLPYRLWELLLGTGTSFFLDQKRVSLSRPLSAAMSWAGVLLIITSTTLFTEQSLFPGWRAALPCVGTALLLISCSHPHLYFTRLLRMPLLIGIGLISYSLYLWHWPLIVLAKYWTMSPLNGLQQTAIFLLVVPIAWLSWKYIETPFRRPAKNTQRRVQWVMASLFFLFAILAVAISARKGFPSRIPSEAMHYANAINDSNPDNTCHTLPLEKVTKGEICRLGHATPRRPDFMLWGDSHADALVPAFKLLAEKDGLYGEFATHMGCPPLQRTYRANMLTGDCSQFNEAMLKLAQIRKVRRVILASAWSAFLANAEDGILDEDPPIVTHPYFPEYHLYTPMQKAFIRGMERTLSQLNNQGIEVWVIEQVPTSPVDVPRTLYIHSLLGLKNDAIGTTTQQHADSQSFVRHVWLVLGQHYKFYRVDPSQSLCDTTNCHVIENNAPLYHDTNHLSASGSRWMAPALEVIFLKKHSNAL